MTPWTVICQAPLSRWILQVRTLEWVDMPSSSGSSQHRNRTEVSCNSGGFFIIWATKEDLEYFIFHQKHFSYFCFNYLHIFINAFSIIYFLLCLMFKHFCSNNLNLYLLIVLRKLIYILHFPTNNILQISYLYFLAYSKNWQFTFCFSFLHILWIYVLF